MNNRKLSWAIGVVMWLLVTLNATALIPWWTFWSAFAAYVGWLVWLYFWPRPVCANHWRTADDRRPVQPCDCGRKGCS